MTNLYIKFKEVYFRLIVKLNRFYLISFLFSLSIFHLIAQEPQDERWLELEVVYSGLPWYNASGGVKTGFVYMDNKDMTAKINFDQVFDWEDNLSLFIYALGNHGKPATPLMGDFQVASNIEAPESWRFFEVWIQQNLFKDRLSILAGLYDLNSEFDILRPGTLFINSSFGIGAEYAQSGVNGPSIFPISSLSVRLSSFVGNRTRVRLAILDAVPGDPENLKSNTIKLSSDEGALIAGEVSIYTGSDFSDDQKEYERTYVTRRRKVGRGQDVYKKDKINVGGWLYTANFQTLSDTIRASGNYGLYLGVQKYIKLNDKDDYVALFGRFGLANDRFNRYGSALSGGFVMSNPISRFDDSFGIAFSSGFNGSDFKNIHESNETTETAIEFTYSLPLKSWIMLQPDLQYIINPSTREELSNPLAFAMLLQLSFEY